MTTIKGYILPYFATSATDEMLALAQFFLEVNNEKKTDYIKKYEKTITDSGKTSHVKVNTEELLQVSGFGKVKVENSFGKGNNMIIYFTGTGNSRYCAQMLADKLEDKLIDSFNYIKDGIAAELVSATPWVFVSPTYCWQLPHIFEEFIRGASFEGCKEAYFVMTCGSDIGNAGEKIAKLCEEVGLNYRGVLPVVMPENYIAMFEVPQMDLAKRIVLVAKRPLLKVVRTVRKGEQFPEAKVNFVDKFKSGPLNPIFYKLFVKAKPFYTTEACIGCGKCATGCVLNNISIKDGKPEWGDACTHCMACICGCPTAAIEYGKKSLGKPRYQCEEYKQ